MTIGNKTLEFLFVPNLHWPDTMYTFIEEEQILVTCDSFGAHYCLPEVVSSEIKNEADYQSALKYYYDCIIGPFKPFMLKALDRVETMDISGMFTLNQFLVQRGIYKLSAYGTLPLDLLRAKENRRNPDAQMNRQHSLQYF